MPSSDSILITLISIGSFLSLWALTCLFISFFGWGELAKRHRAVLPAEGTRHSGRSLSLGRLASYNACVTIHTSRSGLHLALFPIFRIAHPPLFIPWSAVRFLKQRQGMLGPRFLYDLGTPRVRRISVQADVHQAIQEQQSGIDRS